MNIHAKAKWEVKQDIFGNRFLTRNDKKVMDFQGVTFPQSGKPNGYFDTLNYSEVTDDQGKDLLQIIAAALNEYTAKKKPIPNKM